MDDTLHCPICRRKFRTVNIENRRLYMTEKVGNWKERTCTGPNHSLQIFSDVESKKVDLLTLSLNPKYSKYLEIDFVNQRCRINCMKDGKSEYIHIDKMIEPDFPNLIKLKERVALYIVFS